MPSCMLQLEAEAGCQEILRVSRGRNPCRQVQKPLPRPPPSKRTEAMQKQMDEQKRLREKTEKELKAVRAENKKVQEANKKGATAMDADDDDDDDLDDLDDLDDVDPEAGESNFASVSEQLKAAQSCSSTSARLRWRRRIS